MQRWEDNRHQAGQPTPFHPSNARNGVLEVRDARGGHVRDYQRDIFDNMVAGNQIRVRGICDSACAEILNYAPNIRTPNNPNGTIDISDATFRVHQASTNYGPKSLEETRRILSLYPEDALRRGRVPSAEEIGRGYFPVYSRDIIRALDQQHTGGQPQQQQEPAPRRRGLFGRNRRD